VNLNLFVFDYDLTWIGFFLDADLRVYSRYGGRDAAGAEARLSAEGLLHTMNEVLRVHGEETAKKLPPPALAVSRPEDIPTMKKYLPYRGSNCIHCHLIPHAAYD